LYSTLSLEYADSWTSLRTMSSENQNSGGAPISTQELFPQTTEMEKTLKTLSNYMSKNPFKLEKTESLSSFMLNKSLLNPHP
jgi:hypothetical protein